MQRISQHLESLWQRVNVASDIEPQMEAEWLNLFPLFDSLSGSDQRHALKSWYQLGYFIYDRQKNVGAALRCLLAANANAEPNVDDCASQCGQIFLYAAFVADDKQVALIALRNLIETMPVLRKGTLNRLRLLVRDYVREMASSHVPTVMADAIIQFLGCKASELRGESLSGADLKKIVG